MRIVAAILQELEKALIALCEQEHAKDGARLQTEMDEGGEEQIVCGMVGKARGQHDEFGDGHDACEQKVNLTGGHFILRLLGLLKVAGRSFREPRLYLTRESLRSLPTTGAKGATSGTPKFSVVTRYKMTNADARMMP